LSGCHDDNENDCAELTDCVVDEELADGAAEGKDNSVCHEFGVSEDEGYTG